VGVKLTTRQILSEPYPFGVSVKTRIEREMGSAPESYDVETAVLEIVWGKEAWEHILSPALYVTH
jgi:hypothetical protein